jgi:hypothetical protein
MARANLVKAIVKLKREILRNPVGSPCGYELRGLARLSGATEEVVLATLRGLAESGCITLVEQTYGPQRHLRIICLPAAKEHRCRKIELARALKVPM